MSYIASVTPHLQFYLQVFTVIFLHYQANEVLLFGRKLTAQEALDVGLLTAIFPDATFKEEVQKRVAEYSQLPRNVSCIFAGNTILPIPNKARRKRLLLTASIADRRVVINHFVTIGFYMSVVTSEILR